MVMIEHYWFVVQPVSHTIAYVEWLYYFLFLISSLILIFACQVVLPQKGDYITTIHDPRQGRHQLLKGTSKGVKLVWNIVSLNVPYILTCCFVQPTISIYLMSAVRHWHSCLSRVLLFENGKCQHSWRPQRMNWWQEYGIRWNNKEFIQSMEWLRLMNVGLQWLL